ncbi:MAG: hypothetical protein Q4F00_01465 [bacterium]|nr:hypothetical protein [bacterium]
MHDLQMFTYTFPWWATLLFIIFFIYLSIALNINPDYFLPIYYTPARLLGGIVLFLVLGYLMPRVRFGLQGVPLLSNVLGTLPDGKVMGIFLGILCLILSLVSWSIYAVVRPRDTRLSEHREKKDEDD